MEGGGQQGRGRRYKLQTENSSDTHTHCSAAVAAGDSWSWSCSVLPAPVRKVQMHFYLGHSLLVEQLDLHFAANNNVVTFLSDSD